MISTILWLLSTAAIIRSQDSTTVIDTEKIRSVFEHQQLGYNCLKESLACVTKISNTQLEKIDYMLQNWEKNVNLEYKNTTNKLLVLGNSGAGISTFVKFLAYKDGLLISEETGIDTEEYLVSDGNNIEPSKITSITQHVKELELSVDTSIIDIPGFSQSRSIEEEIFVSHNIATYLRKLNNPSHKICVKIVILTEYFSVQHGMNKENFINLLKNIYKNFEHVNVHNVILIVTKVPNKYNTDRKIIDDKNVVRNVADFIKREREYVNNKIKNVSCEENFVLSLLVQIMDTLLETDDNKNYKRINIFRQPDAQGALINLRPAQENKRSLINFLNLDKNACPQIINTALMYLFNLPPPPISKKPSPRYEQFKSCIQEKVNSNIQDAYDKIKILIPKHNVTEENCCVRRFSYYDTYSELSRLNQEINNMYKLKHRIQDLE